MRKTILTYGLIAGLIAGGACFATATAASRHLPIGWAMALGYLTMLIAFSAIVPAVKRHRDGPCGGRLGFVPALGIGLGITLIASVLYALGWEATLAVNGGPDAFLDGYLAQRRAQGGDPAALAAELREIEAMRGSYANPLFRLPISMSEIAPVGVLVSVVTAAVLRRTARPGADAG